MASIISKDNDPDISNENEVDDESLGEKLQHSVQGEDEPMEETHPYATAAMVGLTYPIALVVVLLVVLAIAAMAW